ncbi:hypothetical protein Tco_0914921 [Tanacetum coccineum]
MMTLKFADTHNMVAFLSKPVESDGFEQIVDFLNAQPIRYALTLHTLVDDKKIIISEAFVRRDLKLEEEEGIDCLPNSTIFEQLALMGYEKCLSPKTTAWNEFSSTMASAIICLAILTDPHHTPTFIQSSPQPQKTQKPRKPKRKDTQVPQPSDPIKNVANEVVHKKLGDSLVRATTTASSLEAEQDNGNINKTQSKATPNESSSLVTTLGGGPRCQETIRDTIVQTRVLDLENTKTTQQNEIVRLKMRVKKLEKKYRSRTHKLKRLYKFGLTARIESSDNEESLEQEVAAYKENDEVNVGNVVSTVGDATNVSTATTTTATITTVDDITLAQALMEIKSTKPKEKMVVIQELGESTTTISSQLSSQQSQDKGKGILIEPVKPIKKKDLIRLDEETVLNLQAEFDEEERLAREKAKKEKEPKLPRIETMGKIIQKTDWWEWQRQESGTELIQENTKKQKVEDEKETTKLKQLMKIIPDEEEVAIDAIPLAVKSPSIVG